MSNAWALRPLPFAVTAASTTAAGYSADYMKNDYAGVVWKSDPGVAQALIIDMGAAIALDTALFFGVDGVGTSATLGITAGHDAAMTSGAWSPPAPVQFLAGSTFPSHGKGVGYWEGSGAPARRYWRFDITTPSGGALTISRIMVGVRLTLERNFSFGAAFGVRDFGTVDFSSQGVLLRRRAAKRRTAAINFQNVRRDEVIAKVQPLLELCAGQEPIAIVTDPAADANRQLRCWAGWMTGELGTIQRAAHAWVWPVKIVDMIPIPKAA
jgi:hypothetical protein